MNWLTFQTRNVQSLFFLYFVNESSFKQSLGRMVLLFRYRLNESDERMTHSCRDLPPPTGNFRLYLKYIALFPSKIISNITIERFVYKTQNIIYAFVNAG